MTKEEIIDGLEIYTVGRPNKARVYITVEELQKFIDAIKTLYQTEWIPCSKKLPENEVEVLIFTTDGKINKAYRRIQSWTIRMEWPVFETLGYGYIYDDEVLAWMPLPKSYKGE